MPRTKPVVYLYSVDGANLTEDLMLRIVRLTVTDQEGIESDRLEVELDDRGVKVRVPEPGNMVELALGYQDDEKGVPIIGRYVVDEVRLSGPPSTISFTAKGADMVQSALKAPRLKTWHDTTLGKLAREIAKRHDLEPVIHPEIDKIQIEHLDQQNESDMALLQRLAKRYDLTLKLGGGQLVLRPHAANLEPSDDENREYGLAPGRVVIDIRECSRYEWTSAQRSQYGAVSAHYWDPDKGKEVEVIEGDPEAGPTLKMRHSAGNKKDAMRQAASRLRQLKRSAGSLRLDLPGNTHILAGARLVLEGITEPVSGEWTIEQVEHRLDAGGLVTTLEAVPPTTEEAQAAEKKLVIYDKEMLKED